MAKKITNPALSAMREAAEVEPARARVRCRSARHTATKCEGAPQGLSYGQRQSEQMVNKSLSVAAKYIKFRGFVRLDELEVTGSPLVMFHPRSS